MMEAAGNSEDRRPLTKGSPLTSIIIPVFNKADLTFQCLRSLLAEIDTTETEIIVVNNASVDETAEMLSYMGGLVSVIENPINRGFVEACNQGAAIARGKYLIFLNNDTVVLPGWLHNLVDTVEDDAQVGAVGSMLIFPDGRLQEAGGIVWNDGHAANYGWGESPENPRFNFAREVDYCSGASLLVRKDLFEQLGGFDMRFAPAYYEDTDLCFGVRSLGYKVMYQPASRLVHFEGGTAGRDLQSGYKRFQEVNRPKFLQKWREVLEREHMERHRSNHEAASDRRRGARILVFDATLPVTELNAGTVRMAALVKMLARNFRTVFIPLDLSTSKDELVLGKHGIETAPLMDYKRLLRERRFEVAILSRPDVAGPLLKSIRRTSRQTKIVFDTVDIHFVRFEREYALTGDSLFRERAQRYRAAEKRIAEGSDQVWCVTSEDEAALSAVAPGVPVRIVPTIHPVHARGKSFSERQGILFIGGFVHRPNVDAVNYFVNEILPLVRKKLPDAIFFIVGSSVPKEILQYNSENISVTGFVPNVGPLFESCRLFVAPLRYGAGIKGKVGQALSYGLPVVTTSIGAEGMRLRSGHEALIEDDAVGFANAVVRAYSDEVTWQQLSDEGYEHARKHFSLEAVQNQVQKALEELISPKSRNSIPSPGEFEGLPRGN
jgi:GT2 family glycosyltransferase